VGATSDSSAIAVTEQSSAVLAASFVIGAAAVRSTVEAAAAAAAAAADTAAAAGAESWAVLVPSYLSPGLGFARLGREDHQKIGNAVAGWFLSTALVCLRPSCLATWLYDLANALVIVLSDHDYACEISAFLQICGP